MGAWPNHRLQPTPSSLRCAAASGRGWGAAFYALVFLDDSV